MLNNKQSKILREAMRRNSPGQFLASINERGELMALVVFFDDVGWAEDLIEAFKNGDHTGFRFDQEGNTYIEHV